jgi:hypothetical protein
VSLQGILSVLIAALAPEPADINSINAWPSSRVLDSLPARDFQASRPAEPLVDLLKPFESPAHWLLQLQSYTYHQFCKRLYENASARDPTWR